MSRPVTCALLLLGLVLQSTPSHAAWQQGGSHQEAERRAGAPMMHPQAPVYPGPMQRPPGAPYFGPPRAPAAPYYPQPAQQRPVYGYGAPQPAPPPAAPRGPAGQQPVPHSLSVGEAAQRAQQLNGGGRVLAVDPAPSGYRVRVLKNGEVRSVYVPGNN
ncbi:MAG: hypothetical protein ISP90_12150 [Nevskia sp.]|nr:hypothetical protein [Nevskia sp.]